MSSLEEIRATLEEEGGLLTGLVSAGPVAGVFDDSVGSASPGEENPQAFADGALVLECVLEGYLMHRARPRLVDSGDMDLLVLAGDYLYALGLARLTVAGDTEAVEILAELITECSDATLAAGSGGREQALWASAARRILNRARPMSPDAEARLEDRLRAIFPDQ